MLSRAALLTALLLAGPYTAATADEFSTLEERMSAAEFKAAGLDKLSAAELGQLNAWIDRELKLPAASAQATAASAPASAATAPAAAAPASADMRGFDLNAGRSEIRSEIVGSFTGWSGRTVFRLANGQVWQQSENDAFAVNLESPGVVIEPAAFGTWLLKVDGYNRSVRVKRIQ